MSYQTPYLNRRGDTFFFRIAVPADLRAAIGLRELVKTLQTQDRCAALPVALSLASQAKQLFTRLRGMADKKTNSKRDLPRFDYTLEYEVDDFGLPKRIKI